jgi:hypothetical protein
MPWTTPPAICPSTTVGLMSTPQSCAIAKRESVTLPVSGSTSTIAPKQPVGCVVYRLSVPTSSGTQRTIGPVK